MVRQAFVSVAVLLFCPTRSAAQQPLSEPCKQSSAMLDEGYALMNQHLNEEALSRFQKAHELCPEPRAVAKIGGVEAALGRWVDADHHLRGALAEKNDEWVIKHHDELEQALAFVGTHLAHVTVLGGDPGSDLVVDGVSLGKLPLTEPATIAPGAHEAEIRPPGDKEVQRRSISPAAGETAQIDLRSTETPPPPPVVAPRFFDSTLHKVGVAGLSAGVLLVVGGITAHRLYWEKVNHWNYDCVYMAINRTRDQNCPGELDTINAMQGLVTAGYAVGGALSIASVVMLALPAKKERTTVACGAGPGEFGIACGGMF